MLLISICSLCLSPMTATASNLSNQPNMNSERTSKVEWRYKVINGVLYKRLYDYTFNRWIGDWIKVQYVCKVKSEHK